MPGMAINQEQMMKRKQPDSPSHHTSEVPASAAQVSSARAAETLSNKRQALPAKEGSDPFTPEYHDKATFFKRRTPSQSEIKTTDFNQYTAEQMYNKIRALQGPYPNPYILCKDGTKLFITQSYVETN